MKIKSIINAPKIKIVKLIILSYNYIINICIQVNDNKESENENDRYYNSKIGISQVNKSNLKQSLNPLQLKKSYNLNSQRLFRTIEKKEKEKDIIISVNKGYKDVLTFLQELNMGNQKNYYI